MTDAEADELVATIRALRGQGVAIVWIEHIVLVGGLGTFEGPLVGAVVFFAIQHWFADLGAWYLIGLGATAVGFALLAPRGAWRVGLDRAALARPAVPRRLPARGARRRAA